MRRFLPISGSVGFLYDLPLGVVARLTGQRVERAPDATELFYKGPHNSTQTFEIGTPALSLSSRATPPRSASSAPRATSVSMFRPIHRLPDSSSSASPARNVTLTLSPARWVVRVRSTKLSTRRRTRPSLVPRSSPSRIWPHLAWGLGHRGPVRFCARDLQRWHVRPQDASAPARRWHLLSGHNWFARLFLLHAFAQNELRPSIPPTPGYNLLNTEARYTFRLDRPKSVVPEMTIGLRAENLRNDDIRYSTSFKKDEVLQPGTNVRLFGIVDRTSPVPIRSFCPIACRNIASSRAASRRSRSAETRRSTSADASPTSAL